MAKYIVVQDPKTRKTRVRRVEELRPGQGIDSSAVRKLPMERRAKFAGFLSWWSGAKADFRDRVESRRIVGMVVFLALVYGLPITAVMLHVNMRYGVSPGAEDSTIGGIAGVLVAGIVIACIWKFRPHRKRRSS